MAVSETLKEVRNRISEITKTKKNDLQVWTENVYTLAIGSVRDYASENKEIALGMLNETRNYFKDSFKAVLHSMYLYDAFDYREEFIRTTSISYRILAVLFGNFPLLIFSRGFNRIRYPILFTFIASTLVVPEIVNPYNRID
jgi:hypothetical protein